MPSNQNLPSYFTPITEDEQSLPDYFTPIEEKEDDSNKIIEAGKKIWEKASEPLTEAPTRFAESVSKYIDPERSTSGVRGYGSAYIEGLGQAVSGLSSPLNLAMTLISGGASAAAKAGMPKIVSALDIGTKVLSAPIIAEGVKHIASAKDIPEYLSGILEAGLGAAGMRSRTRAAEELPIRRPRDYVTQSREIPYRAEGRVQRALSSGPRFVAGENGVRDLHSAKAATKTSPIISREAAPTVNLTQFMNDNPDATMIDIENFVKGLKSKEVPIKSTAKIPISQSISEAPTTELPIRRPNEAALAAQGGISDQAIAYNIEEMRALRGTLEDIPNNPVAQQLEAERQAIEQKAKFVNPFEKPQPPTEIPIAETPKLPEYFKPIEEPQVVIKPAYTIENAPPNQRAKMFRGAHEPVEILFDSPASREAFGAGQRMLSSTGEVKPGVIERFKEASERIAKKLNLTPQEARGAIRDYNAEVRKLGSAVDKEGGNITAPSFEEFVKARTTKTEILSAVEIPKIEQPVTETLTEQPSKLSDRTITRLQKLEDDAVARIKKRGTFSGGRLSAGLPVDDLADLSIIGASKLAKGAVKFADWSVEMVKDFGEAIKPHLDAIFKAAQERHGKFASVEAAATNRATKTEIPVEDTLRSVFNSLVEQKGMSTEQQAINKAERAKRFAASAAIKEGGVSGAAKRLAAMKGEFEKVGLGEGLGLNAGQTNSLFDVINKAKISEPERIEAISALFKFFNGEVLPPSRIKMLDKVFEPYLRNIGGPGASGGYDIAKTEEARAALADYISKNPRASMDEVKEFIGTLKTPTKASSFNEAIAKAGNKEQSKFWDYYDLSKGLMSADIPFMTSAAFRQGSGLFGTRRWFQAYAEQAKAFKNEELYDKIMASVDSSPIHQQRAVFDPSSNTTKLKSIADEIGLTHSDLKHLSTREEQIKTSLAERIPYYGRYIRANNRSFTAFLNSLRTHTAEDWLKAGNLIDEAGNITNLAEAKRIGNTINELTGQGGLKISQPLSRFTGSTKELDLERHSKVLNRIFFSPHNTMRDARMMNPLNYIKNDKLVRMEYLKGAIRRAGVWAGFTTLASLMGAKVSNDITSSDFGKAVLGNTRLDAGTGLLQWVVMMGRQALGETTSSTTGKTQELGSGFGSRTRLDVLDEFAKNRLHPAISFATGALSATKSRPFYAGNEVMERALPFMASDFHDLMKDDPDTAQVLLGLLAASASMGSQTYGPKDYGKPQFEIPGDIKFEGGKILGSSKKKTKSLKFRKLN